MKHSLARFLALAGTAAVLSPAAFGGTQKPADAPLVITRPAVPNGSNFARAPFPAARLQNDVTPPDGEAFDEDLPPNTPATTPAPMSMPPPAYAIFQSDPVSDPGSLPTGRPTFGAAAALEPNRVQPVITSATYEGRESVIDDVRARVRQSQVAVADYRRSRNQMSESGREQFSAAIDDVRAAEKQLDRSLRAAERASSDRWESTRAQLAADYQSYVSALSRLDASAGITPPAPAP